MTTSSTAYLQLEGITKRFPGVLALDGVDFDVAAGEIHCLLGENGAGKSTLMKILSGAYQKDSGRICIDSKEVEIVNPQAAERLGISIIYQELNLIPALTVTENIFLGRELVSRTGRIDSAAMRKEAQEILDTLQISLASDAVIRSLSMGKQQMVEIAKAITRGGRILIMDEPTASLGSSEIRELFEIIRQRARAGTAIIYISHRLEELFEIGDRVTVIRDGRKIATRKVADTTRGELISLMVGRDINEQYQRKPTTPGPELLRVEHLDTPSGLKDVSFTLHAGEVLGFAGLVGSGRTELMRAIFGADRKTKGKVYLNGKLAAVPNPEAAVRNKIGFLTEDRKAQGLFLAHTVARNVTISALERMGPPLRLNAKVEQSEVQNLIQALRIRTPSAQQIVRNLSGGNQQKTVIARWLFTKSKILIFDEPTRGVDVGAKAEIYNIIDELARSGVGIILVSSDLPEILTISDRIAVMSRGHLTGIIDRSEATQEGVLKLALEGGRRSVTD